MTNRVKRLSFQLNYPRGIAKYEWMAVFRKLPDDAEVIDARVDHYAGYDVLQLKIQSSEYDEVVAGTKMPELPIWVSYADIEAEKKKPTQPSAVAAKPRATPHGLCTCDIDYTGERTHKDYCTLAGVRIR